MESHRARLLRVLGLGFATTAAYACTMSFVETPSTPLPAVTVVGTLATDPVWGVADLHAHPAAHLAFGGLDGAGLIWGDPGLPDSSLTAVPGGNLPDIPACDPDTHSSNVTDQVSRATRALVFSLLTQTTNFPHVAHGGAAQDGEPPYESWPNGRDILHEYLNIQSIRRAYEGGLRLMFAATVDSQPIGLAMRTTIFPSPFVPSRAAERASAEAQLIFIRSVVSANSDWMEIATTPDQAENAIRQNRLAVVLALENDGLLLDDVKYLVDTYGVASIVPIHLIDNDVGGTAAYNDVFNAGTELMGSMFGYPNRYISVEPDDTLSYHLSWPLHLAISGPNFDVGSVDYPTAAALGYSQYPLCNPPGMGIPGELGSRNSVGLREPQTMQTLMDMGLLVDLAHMGFRSTAETIELAQSTCNYPLIDTHTTIHLRDHGGGDERALFEDHADYIAATRGLVGHGSTGRTSESKCDPAAGGSDTIASARGGPLAYFADPQFNTVSNGRAAHVTIALPAGGRACTPALPATAAAVGVRVVAAQNVPAGSIAYTKLSFDGGHQQYAQIDLNQVSPVPLDPGQTAASIGSMDIGLLSPDGCSYGDGTTIDVASVEISDATGNVLATIGRSQLGTPDNDGSQVVATLGSSRSSFTIYSRCPSTNTMICDAAENFLSPPTEPIEHLRIRVRSGPQSLKSDSGLIVGARVTGALCNDPKCADVPDPCSKPGFTMTPEGGWPSGTELDQYVSFPRPAPRSFQAVQLCILEENLAIEPWVVEEIDVDVVTDPIRLWTGDYGATDQRIFGGRQGALAMGTDSNGLSPQFPFADYAPSYTDDAMGCGNKTGPTNAVGAQYGDPSTGGTFTLHRPQQIGGTPLCLADRGLASYGMLPEFFAAVYHYNRDVYRSLFSSAAATIAAWRAVRAASLAFATAPTTCVAADGGANDGGANDGAPDAGSEGAAPADAAGGP
jgi:microsomal dipeptidase-like Zn-dependent dipeptidase